MGEMTGGPRWKPRDPIQLRNDRVGPKFQAGQTAHHIQVADARAFAEFNFRNGDNG